MLRQLNQLCRPIAVSAGGNSSSARYLHSSVCAFVQNVVVPSMGDSITEGTVAEIHKRQHDPVEEDEPILTLETDKVSIEVRSPQYGVIQALLVQPDDVVQIGQLIALVDDSISMSKQQPGVQSFNQQAYDALADAASEVSDKTLRGHKARIRFPPRRTSDGHVISAMPAVDQQTYIDRSHSSQESPRAVEMRMNTREQNSPPGNQAVTAFVPRRILTEREMEAIMLGGAE